MISLHGFPGGIFPPEQKQQSTQTAIEKLPLPPLLILPLKQHIGSPAIPVVQEGDRVKRGQLIAKAGAGLSAALHAPADGEISFMGLHPVTHESGMEDWCIAIAVDEQSDESFDESETEYHHLSDDDIQQRIAQAGIVGLGGAGFPTHYKLAESPVRYLIINGAECEPYISCDDRLMTERAGDIIDGIQITARLLKPEHIIIAIEDNKPDAIAAINALLHDSKIELAVIPTKYPSGAQKQLIQNLLGIEIAAGSHSIDVGIVMYNVGTCYAIARALAHGEPLISRIVTIAGEAVTRPGNYEVAIGTPIEYALACAGVNPNKLARVVLGGPIMGVTVNHVSAPITKISNCLIAATKNELDFDLRARECIRCGDCVEACPAGLLPQQLYWQIKAQQYDKAANLHLSACIECGACAYVCPSHIPLVHYYRHGKAAIHDQKKEKQFAHASRERFEWRQERLTRDKLERETKRNSLPSIEVVELTKEIVDEVPAPVIDDKAAQIAAAVARAKAKKEALKKWDMKDNES